MATKHSRDKCNFKFCDVLNIFLAHSRRGRRNPFLEFLESYFNCTFLIPESFYKDSFPIS